MAQIMRMRKEEGGEERGKGENNKLIFGSSSFQEPLHNPQSTMQSNAPMLVYVDVLCIMYRGGGSKASDEGLEGPPESRIRIMLPLFTFPLTCCKVTCNTFQIPSLMHSAMLRLGRRIYERKLDMPCTCSFCFPVHSRIRKELVQLHVACCISRLNVKVNANILRRQSYEGQGQDLKLQVQGSIVHVHIH